MGGGFRSSFPTVVNEWRFCSSFPPHRPLMIGGFSFVFERVAVPHAFGRGKRPVNERISATHLGNERISATHLGNERISATSSLMIGGFSIVLERVAVPHAFGRGKRPVNERVSATHLENKRIAATHLTRRGQAAVSFQNEGEESITGGAYKPYKRMVSPGAHIRRNVKEAPLPLAINGPLWWC